MAEDLSSLILRLSTYQPVGPNVRPKALNFVQDYPRFISTLTKINQMISIVQPIKTLDQTLLRQNLSIRETQLKQAQNKLRTIEAKARETLTLYNNVRKKVQAKNSQQSGHIQSKFQD